MSLRDRIRKVTLQNPGVIAQHVIQDEEGELIIELREPSYAAKMELAKWARHDGEQPADAPADDPNKEYEPSALELGLRAIASVCYEPGGSEPIFTMADIEAAQNARGTWLNDLAVKAYKIINGEHPDSPTPESAEGK